MILLPIGHEEDGVRRLPWVSFGVMILCALAFFATGRQALFADDDTAVSEDVLRAIEYYLEHPYLELDAEFQQEFLPDGDQDEEFAAMLEAYKGMAGPPPTIAGVRETEQEVLDGLMAAAVEAFEDHPLMRWGLVPDDMSIVTLFTHMFLHAGWLHLIGNMLIFYLAGPFIEDVWGRPLYLGFYLLAGVAAALLHITLNADSSIPMIGASGAIAGVMGAFLVRYWSTKIRFFYMFGFFFRGTFSAPAWVMLPMWFGQQLFFAALTHDMEDGGGVAYGAHIGGFVFGVAVAFAIKTGQIEERYIHPVLEGKIHSAIISNEGVERALQLQQEGHLDQAFDLLAQETRRSPSNLDASLAFWSVAADSGRARHAAPAALRAVQQLLRSNEGEHALTLWREIHDKIPGLDVKLPLLLRMAQAFAEGGQDDEAATALRKALLSAGAAPGAALALKIAMLAATVDPTVARAAVRLTLAQRDIDPDTRTRTEELAARLGPATAGPAPSAVNSGEPLKLS